MASISWDSLEDEQRDVADSDAEALLVLGSAGVGKTTTALWASRRHLTLKGTVSRADPSRRVLFVTFSRTAVAQIRGRIHGVLEGLEGRVEILTFHGLAFRLVRAFGNFLGLDEDPSLVGEARTKLDVGIESNVQLHYRDLIPLTRRLLESPGPIGEFMRERWSMVICDEFQDTDDGEWRLLQIVAEHARLLLLADPNQMIYGFKPGVSEARIKIVLNHPNCERVTLMSGSHRDPSQVLPRAAEEIRCRRFDTDPVRLAVEAGQLHIRADVPDCPDERAATIAEEVRRLREDGHETFGIYAKTNADVSRLSTALVARGCPHVPIGFGEAFGECLNAMLVMTTFAQGDADWSKVRTSLAVALTSTVRSPNAPPLAKALHRGQFLSPAFDARISDLQVRLEAADDLQAAAELAGGAWQAIGFDSGHRAWRRARERFASLTAHAALDTDAPMERLNRAVAQTRDASFVELDSGDAGLVQLMNFSQTKGREADAVILSYSGSDWYGWNASEPFDEPSRLLYVCLTRARECVVVLLPKDPHPLVAPFLEVTRHAAPVSTTQIGTGGSNLGLWR